ncbi:hypothetical protein H0H92_006269 [Tricholoma furcatifolium]|nr:hypothetical protein H0H92_006269 [Tricholoma furcatifolium]
MTSNARRPYIPTFTLHGAPYDPPVPTVAPIPRSAPIYTSQFPVNVQRPPVNSPRPSMDAPRSPLDKLRSLVNTPRSPGPGSTRAPSSFLHPNSGPSRDGNGNGRSARNSRMVATEIADTVAIMRENIQSVTDRGERLESLESRTESLAASARNFRKTSSKVHKGIWWREMKVKAQSSRLYDQTADVQF